MPNMTRAYGQRPPAKPPTPEVPERVTNSVVSVGPSPVRLGVRDSRSQIIVHNPSAETIFLGGRSVSASDSFPVQPGGYASLDVSAEVVLWAVSSSPEEIELRILEIE
jgi:hypothetical protein